MSVIKDFYCEDCGEVYEDMILSDGSVIPICETCKRDLTWLPSKMNFKGGFAGSHVEQYGSKPSNKSTKIHTKESRLRGEE